MLRLKKNIGSRKIGDELTVNSTDRRDRKFRSGFQ